MTPFQEIYNRFLTKISDPVLLDMFEDEMEDQLRDYLITSVVKFPQCKKGKSINLTDNHFEEKLTMEEIEIYATFMVAEWIQPMINNIQSLKPLMVTRDYQSYSQANHLDKMVKLRDTAEAQAKRMMVTYTYYGGDK